MTWSGIKIFSLFLFVPAASAIEMLEPASQVNTPYPYLYFRNSQQLASLRYLVTAAKICPSPSEDFPRAIEQEHHVLGPLQAGNYLICFYAKGKINVHQIHRFQVTLDDNPNF